VGIDELLEESRRGMRRLAPHDLADAAALGALIVDTRTERQRREQGEFPGAIVIDRTVLEWRLDPKSDEHIPEATDYDVEIVVVCREGYSSSIAAATLRALGLHRATDLAGGVEAWVEVGLPMTTGPADERL
jgi:rhodanese-related sulfurtransferase